MCNLSGLELEFLSTLYCKELNIFTGFDYNVNHNILYDNIWFDISVPYFSFLNFSNLCVCTSSVFFEYTLFNNIFSILNSIIIETFLDNYFEVKFFSRVSNFSLLEFISLQDSIIICPGETGLVFFRVFNPLTHDLTGLSLYFIFPSNISIYVHKIQCFRFDLIQIKANESIELPILFYLDTLLWYDSYIFDRLIYISYIFFLR